MTPKQKILEVKTEAIIEAIERWAEDNKILWSPLLEGTKKQYPLENYIKTVLNEMD